MNGQTRAAADRAISDAMRSRGWRAEGECWVRELTHDVAAWVGVGLSGRDEVDANPMVGVRHTGVKRLVSPDERMAPTVVLPLYEVRGDTGTYEAWTFRDDNLEEEANAVADAVENVMPVLRKMTSLQAIEAALREKSFADIRRVKPPATLILLGRLDEARSVVEQELHELRLAGDAAITDEYELTMARLLAAAGNS